MNNKKVKFKRIVNIIYGMCPGTTVENKKQLLQMKLINTVDKNKVFTKRQQAESKRERELFNSVVCQSVEDLKAAI